MHADTRHGKHFALIMDELRTNEFYLKKLYRAAEVTDVDKVNAL